MLGGVLVRPGRFRALLGLLGRRFGLFGRFPCVRSRQNPFVLVRLGHRERLFAAHPCVEPHSGHLVLDALVHLGRDGFHRTGELPEVLAALGRKALDDLDAKHHVVRLHLFVGVFEVARHPAYAVVERRIERPERRAHILRGLRQYHIAVRFDMAEILFQARNIGGSPLVALVAAWRDLPLAGLIALVDGEDGRAALLDAPRRLIDDSVHNGVVVDNIQDIVDGGCVGRIRPHVLGRTAVRL